MTTASPRQNRNSASYIENGHEYDMKSTKWNMADVCIWISDMKAFIACSSSLTCYVVSAKVAAKAQAKAKAHAKAQAKALPHAPVQSASSIVDKFFAVTELPTENCLNFGKGGRVFFSRLRFCSAHGWAVFTQVFDAYGYIYCWVPSLFRFRANLFMIGLRLALFRFLWICDTSYPRVS